MKPALKALRPVVAAMLAGPFLAACSSSVLETGSLWVTGEGQNPGGISYTLAKAVLQIKVRMWEREARIAVCVS
ncbi:MAG: hypothetical protein ABL901_09440, partial [Hyphomicrobiaceae bacterium]